MHATPDLRVFLKWIIAGSGSFITVPWNRESVEIEVMVHCEQPGTVSDPQFGLIHAFFTTPFNWTVFRQLLFEQWETGYGYWLNDIEFDNATMIPITPSSLMLLIPDSGSRYPPDTIVLTIPIPWDAEHGATILYDRSGQLTLTEN